VACWNVRGLTVAGGWLRCDWLRRTARWGHDGIVVTGSTDDDKDLDAAGTEPRIKLVDTEPRVLVDSERREDASSLRLPFKAHTDRQTQHNII